MKTGKQRKTKRMWISLVKGHFHKHLAALFQPCSLYRWANNYYGKYDSKHKKRKFKRGYIPKVEGISSQLGNGDVSPKPLEPGSRVVWNLRDDEGKGKCGKKPMSQ